MMNIAMISYEQHCSWMYINFKFVWKRLSKILCLVFSQIQDSEFAVELSSSVDNVENMQDLLSLVSFVRNYRAVVLHRLKHHYRSAEWLYDPTYILMLFLYFFTDVSGHKFAPTPIQCKEPPKICPKVFVNTLYWGRADKRDDCTN